MARVIYEVTAKVIDANGNFSTLSGYPKVFDSRSYQNDTDKTYRRAEGEFYDVWADMCKRDDRMMQTVMMTTADGFMVMNRSEGRFPDDDE